MVWFKKNWDYKFIVSIILIIIAAYFLFIFPVRNKCNEFNEFHNNSIYGKIEEIRIGRGRNFFQLQGTENFIDLYCDRSSLIEKGDSISKNKKDTFIRIYREGNFRSELTLSKYVECYNSVLNK